MASRVVLTTWELVRRHGGSREHLLSARSGALRARAPLVFTTIILSILQMGKPRGRRVKKCVE